MKLEYHLVKRPLGNDVSSGDTGLIREFDDKVFIAVIDVLGHGKKAQKVAGSCEAFLESHYRMDLPKMMQGLHQHIKGSRGAVAGLCHLDLKTGDLKYVGIGDTVARIFGSKSTWLISHSGVIGYMIPKPSEQRGELQSGDILVLYTDGVKTHFGLKDYPDLPDDDARTIATRIIGQFGKDHDDALCIALRYLPEGKT